MPIQYFDPTRGPSAPMAPQGPTPLEEKDLIFSGRYPDLRELIPDRNTYPGLTYVYAPASTLMEMQKFGASQLAKGLDHMPAFSIRGKEDDPSTWVTCLLFAYGTPILGAQGNGKRKVKVHPQLVSQTGIDPDPTSHLANGKVTPEMVEAVRGHQTPGFPPGQGPKGAGKEK